jgi:hypothetical protein
MSRNMTSQEKTQFKTWFPNLDVNKAIVTGEATPAYNCISWTVGVTNAWLWPGSTIQQFDAFYKKYSLKRTASGPVAVWGASTSSMTHGSVSGPSHGPRWESKCGQSLRIQHGLNELVSSTYGRVLGFYSRTAALSQAVRQRIEALSRQEYSVMPTDEQVASIRTAAQRVPQDLRRRFDAAFAQWKASWSASHIIISSDPRAVTHTPEFQELVALGRDIIPLVVEKLTDPENFFALQLYDVLQPEHHMVVESDLSDEHVFEGEQGRARRTVERFASSL